MAGKASRGQTVKDPHKADQETEVYTAGSGSKGAGWALKEFKGAMSWSI